MRRSGALLAALLLSVPLLTAACGRQQPDEAQAAAALGEVGSNSVASEDRGEPLALSGTTLDGDPLDLADLRGKVVVLNSWASWCPPCRAEIPAFIALHETADPEDVVVVGLNVNDDDAAARAFLEELAVPYPSISDPDGALLATVPGVPPASLPSTVILDRDGRPAGHIIGGTNAVTLSTMVADVLSSSPAT
jgi:thiol-disulfide isomerase/thioredoxin